jgi:hypothetical protein
MFLLLALFTVPPLSAQPPPESMPIFSFRQSFTAIVQHALFAVFDPEIVDPPTECRTLHRCHAVRPPDQITYTDLLPATTTSEFLVAAWS